MIALIDYGAGNLTSVRKGFGAAGAALFTPVSAAELSDVRGIVVPGVGHFGATTALSAEWRQAITAAVKRGVPLLGICLGLQWLYEGSDESPDTPGLATISGRCFRLPAIVKVPHVGWNALDIGRQSPVLTGIASGTQVYFTHSYAAPVTQNCTAVTTHGAPFAAVVERDNVMGVQFHPEKSGDAGLRMLANFVGIVADC
jgi:glutamine amidotransferase